MDISDWSLRGAKLAGSLLLFCNIEHCSAKKELKSSSFWRKSLIKLPLWYSRGMIGILLSFKKTFQNGPIGFRAGSCIRQFHRQLRVVFTFCILYGRS